MNKRLLSLGGIAVLTSTFLTLLLLGAVHAQTLQRRPPNGSLDWQIDPVGALPPGVGFHSLALALDADDDAHILFTDLNGLEQDLHYAYQDGGTWYSEPVTTPMSSSKIPLVLDGSGRPHTVFLAAGSVHYAYRDDNGWHFEPIEVGYGEWLALDSEGFPHVSYVQSIGELSELRYGYRDAGGWHLSTVPDVPGLQLNSYYTQMAVDTAGYPHIIFNASGGKHAYQDGSGWHVEDVADSLSYRSLALDQSNYPHLSYADEVNPPSQWEARYIYRDGSGWHGEMIDSTTTTENTSLALGSQDDVPQVAYTDEFPFRADLYYAERSSGSWQLDLVEGSELFGDIQNVSLALDSEDSPHIVYVMQFPNDIFELRHAYIAEGVTLDKSGPASSFAGMPITYTLSIANNSPLTVTNVVLTDRIPSNATYLTGGTLVGDVVSWTVPSLLPGEIITRQFAVTAITTITNDDYRASADGDIEVVGTTAVVTVIQLANDLALSKSGPASASAGMPITYTLAITNSSALTLTNVVLTDRIPINATYLAGGALVGDVVNWIVPSLLPGETITRQFAVTATTTIINDDYRATVAGDIEVIGTTAVVTVIEKETIPELIYLPSIIWKAPE